MRRSARLFALAEALRARRTGVTAEVLAERFNVSIRTIYRDLDTLREASLPLSAERGRGGGYALERSYSLPPVNFNVREAMVLIVLGRMARQLRFLPFIATLDGALDKVRGALPATHQRKLDRLSEGLTFTGVPAHASKPEVRAAIEDAWFDEQPVKLRYLRKNYTEGERVVRLVDIVLERSETLLNVEDLDNGERRQLRLHQLISAELVTRPPAPASR